MSLSAGGNVLARAGRCYGVGEQDLASAWLETRGYTCTCRLQWLSLFQVQHWRIASFCWERIHEYRKSMEESDGCYTRRSIEQRKLTKLPCVAVAGINLLPSLLELLSGQPKK